jgi:hypothetical protein
MNVTGNISCDNSNRNITIAIVKNGVATTQYGPITIRNTTANGYFPFSTVVYLQDVAPNDYFEIYISSANNGDVVTLSDINWFTDAR